MAALSARHFFGAQCLISLRFPQLECTGLVGPDPKIGPIEG